MSNNVHATVVGRRIRERREALGWSQQLLANKAGVSQGTIGHIESGRNRSATKLPFIARALGLTVEELIEGDVANSSRVVPLVDINPKKWPFSVTLEEVASLPQADIALIDATLIAAVRRLEKKRGKGAGT